MTERKTTGNLFLGLTIVEIIAALIFYLQDPSDPETAVFLGLSASRFVVGLVFIFFLLISSWLLVYRLRKPEQFNGYVTRLRGWLSERAHGYITLSILVYLFFMLLGFLILMYSPGFRNYKFYSQLFVNRLDTFELISTLVDRSLPLLILLLVIIFQGVIWLLIDAAYTKSAQPKNILPKILLVLSMLTLSLFHWVVLVLQIRVFMNIHGWYWDLIEKSFGVRDLVFPVLFGLTIFLISIILKKPDSIKRNLLIIFILGWSLQVGFGIIEGQGFESLRLKYINSNHRSHSVAAAKTPRGLIETVRNYEEIYAKAGFQQTKPPGTVLVYIAFKNVTNYFSPRETVQEKFDVLTTGEAYFFPFVSFVVVFFIYKIARKITPGEESILPSILYILIPNVILIPLYLDQVLYPLLFTLGVLVTIQAVDKGTFAWGLLNGAVLYVIAFFSFSMLPLIPFAFLYVGIHFLVNKEDRNLGKSILLGLGIVLGLALMFGFFYFALNYNFFVRYQKAMAGVRNFDFVKRVGASSDEVNNTSFLMKPSQIFSALVLNNIEFSSAIGFPIYLLFLIQSVRTIVAFIKKRSTPGDTVLLTYLGTFVLLNIFAPIQGEAARLWLFWVPMFAIFSGTLIPRIFSRYPRFVYYLATTQLLTIYLLYKFQDLAV